MKNEKIKQQPNLGILFFHFYQVFNILRFLRLFSVFMSSNDTHMYMVYVQGIVFFRVIVIK
jgi:hypothetical protein